VASRLRLPHHGSALNRDACIPRGIPRVVRGTIRHAHCDQVRVENLNLNAQFLQPPSEQKHGVKARPMTRQHRMLLDDRGCGLGYTPERASNTRGRKNAPALRHFSPYLFT
jgi:hypothetical protein